MPVTHCAHFATESAARDAVHALEVLLQEYADYEHSVTLQSSDPPYGDTAKANAIPPPFIAFAARHGFNWPSSCGFLLRGPASDAELIQIDRLVFFRGNGFELGGEAIQTFLKMRGALVGSDEANLVVQCDAPDERRGELAAFLEDEDFEGEFVLLDRMQDDAELLCSITFQSPKTQRVLGFRHRGMEPDAFVAALYQLAGEDPLIQLR